MAHVRNGLRVEVKPHLCQWLELAHSLSTMKKGSLITVGKSKIVPKISYPNWHAADIPGDEFVNFGRVDVIAVVESEPVAVRDRISAKVMVGFLTEKQRVRLLITCSLTS